MVVDGWLAPAVRWIMHTCRRFGFGIGQTAAGDTVGHVHLSDDDDDDGIMADGAVDEQEPTPIVRV